MRPRRGMALSIRALTAHRVRAALAVASVGAGVAAVVLTSAIGAGVQRDVDGRLAALGTNLLVVRPVQLRQLAARSQVAGTVTTLRLDDYEAIAALPAVAYAAPGVERTVKVQGAAASTSTRLLGSTPALRVVRRFALRAGRFFDADDDRAARRVVVLGARVADALFDDDPVGRQIRIRGVPFDVIGVLAPRGALADGDEDNQVLVPIRTALRRVLNVTWLNAVFVRVRDARSVDDVEPELRAAMRARHRLGRDGRPDFEIQNASRFLTMQQRTTAALGGLTTGLAAISLAVGGAGITALMLMSVKERTGEIGLRMAVGARSRDVLLQFLVEATILTVSGWLTGVALGTAGAAAVALATSWPIAAPGRALAVSFAVAVGAGLAFGAVPARRASRIPPLRALRAR